MKMIGVTFFKNYSTIKHHLQVSLKEGFIFGRRFPILTSKAFLQRRCSKYQGP